MMAIALGTPGHHVERIMNMTQFRDDEVLTFCTVAEDQVRIGRTERVPNNMERFIWLEVLISAKAWIILLQCFVQPPFIRKRPSISLHARFLPGQDWPAQLNS